MVLTMWHLPASPTSLSNTPLFVHLTSAYSGFLPVFVFLLSLLRDNVLIIPTNNPSSRYG